MMTATLPYPTVQDTEAYASAYLLIAGNERRELPNISEEMVSGGQAVKLAWDALPPAKD
jgi:hypothetical protein